MFLFFVVVVFSVSRGVEGTGLTVAQEVHAALRKTLRNPILSDLEKIINDAPDAPLLCTLRGMRCDESMILRGVDFSGMSIGGSVVLSALPHLVVNVSFAGCGLQQDASTIASLQATVSRLDVSHNMISGILMTPRESQLVHLAASHNGITAIVWDSLPRDLESLDVSWNPNLRSTLESPRYTIDLITLRVIDMSGCGLKGDFVLPSAWLSSLNYSHNMLTVSQGTLSLYTTETIERIDLSHNQMEGAIEWNTLPTSLRYLSVADNKFSGTIPFSSLAFMHHIDLSGNEFSGTIEFPESQHASEIANLLLARNKLIGVLPAAGYPIGLRHFDVSHNMLTGALPPFPALPSTLVTFNVAHNRLVGKVDLTTIGTAMRFVYIHDNRFTGKADLFLLPRDLRVVHVMNNNWDSDMPPLTHPYDTE